VAHPGANLPVPATLINSDADLASACERWSTAGIIGVDTEFIRESTYHPRPGLIQVSDGAGVTLVDPIGISDFGPLKWLISNPSVVKVMHAYEEDAELLEVLTGVTPRRVFDTQLAAAFAGYGFSLGYSNLVEILFDVILNKEATRSNWLRRPLTELQLRYAALDVLYLLPIHKRLSREMEALGRASWFEEDLEHRHRSRTVDRRPESAYLRVRQRTSLPPAHHAVLRALSQWREIEAMARDIPRRHLLTDEILIALASEPALDMEALEKIKGLSPSAVTRYGRAIIACVDAARSQQLIDTDITVNLRPQAATMKRLKEIIKHKADALKLPPELLANRRTLETLVISKMNDRGPLPQYFQGWRFDIVTETLLAAIPQ
jgi:ribonuclease D